MTERESEEKWGMEWKTETVVPVLQFHMNILLIKMNAYACDVI